MVDREQRCIACDGTGLLADDENWQYTCTVCGGAGVLNRGTRNKSSSNSGKLINVDETNRILD